MKKTFLLLFVSLLLTAQIFATDYLVSGAGTTAINGTYSPDGTNAFGAPRWKLSGGSYYLHSDGWGTWVINNDGFFPFDGYYENYSQSPFNQNIPPSTGWVRNMGANPAPTVGEAGPSLSYSSGTFSESSANDGSIDNSTPVIITHNNFGGGTFTGTNGDNFVTADKVIVSNLPAGLTAVITLTSSTTLSVTITGTALSHNNENDVSNLTFAFQNSAFSTNDTSAISNSTKSGIIIEFFQLYTVATSGGDYTSIEAAFAVTVTGDVIIVEAGTYTENELIIDHDITIQGQGANSTIIQAAASYNTASHRVFKIDYNTTANIKNVTIRHGKATGTDNGGGILCNGRLILENSTVCDNLTSYSGGGYSGYGVATINYCLFNNNSAASAGGLLCEDTLNITNSTITANHATSSGGGIYQQSDVINLTNCTITNNTAVVSGAGIYTDWGFLTISNTIISDNGSSDHHVKDGINSLTDNGYNIIKNQTSSGSPTNWKFSALTNILYNYKADGTASTSWNRNNEALANQNLNLSATLADNNTLNGTQTLALSSGSFAIDAGTDVGAPTTDQRGAGRNGTTDIGAYEWWDDAGALPVELTSFSASVNGGSVVLYWQTSTEVNNYGFEIEKAVSSGQSAVGDGSLSWSKCGFVEGNGNSNSPKVYSFTDKSTTSGKYVYRLKQIDNDGKYEYSKEIEVDVDKIPTAFALAQNYPNPFNPATVISFQLPVDSKVQLKIYDIVGSEVATLVNEERPAGIYTVEFNAANFTSGVYFYRMQAGNFVETKKLLLIK